MSADTFDDVNVLIGIGVDFEAEEDAEYLDPDTPDYLDFHERQYGGRRGIWRVLSLLDRHEIPDATFFTVSALVHSYPDACREIQRRGYEIAAHTVHHEHMEHFTVEQEEWVFRTQQRDLEEFFGATPAGFRVCFPSARTLDFVADYGFYYDTTNRDDDRIYRVTRGERGSFIEIPRGFNGDAPLVGTPVPTAIHTGKYNPPSLVAASWIKELDWLYREGERETKIMTLCLHPYISGRRSRAQALDAFLTHAKQLPKVRFVSHLQLARWFDQRSAGTLVAAGGGQRA